MCPPHREQFERIYGKELITMSKGNTKKAAAAKNTGTSKVAGLAEARERKAAKLAEEQAAAAKAKAAPAPEPEEEEDEPEEGEDDEVDANGDDSETDDEDDAPEGAPATTVDGRPKQGRAWNKREFATLPLWAQRKRGAVLLRGFVKRVAEIDYKALGCDGVDAAKHMLLQAADKLDQLRAEAKKVNGGGARTPAYTFTAGERVRLDPKHTEGYRGVLEDDELEDSMVVHKVAAGYVHVTTDNGQRAAIPAKHLQPVT